MSLKGRVVDIIFVYTFRSGLFVVDNNAIIRARKSPFKGNKLSKVCWLNCPKVIDNTKPRGRKIGGCSQITLNIINSMLDEKMKAKPIMEKD